MSSALLTTAIAAFVTSVITSPPAAAERPPAGGRPKRIRIVTPPVLESIGHETAIIRWTANTAGGTAKHYGIVRYGASPRQLDQTARSPNKWSQKGLPNMTYRVRIDGLAPGTTYYFRIDAAQADGIGMGLKSPLGKLTTRRAPLAAR